MNEMGRECGMYGRHERCGQGLAERPKRKKDHLEDLDIDERILKWIFKLWDGRAWTVLIWIGAGGRLLKMQ